MMTGENISTGRKPCPNNTWLTINRTWICLGLNPDIRCQKPMTDRLNNVAALKIDVFWNVMPCRLVQGCVCSGENFLPPPSLLVE
jgi:hypothetical protein